MWISGGGGLTGGVLPAFLSILGENSGTFLSVDFKLALDTKAEDGFSGRSGFFC